MPFFVVPYVPGVQSAPYVGCSSGVKGKKHDPVTRSVVRSLIHGSLGLC